ncbi:MAG: hypothetical protein ACK4ND_15555 [Cytophagaceae bacterium]
MSTKNSREELEKFRLSLQKHIQSLDERNKELRRKQVLLEKIAEKLRLQEMEVNGKIHSIIKQESPFVQPVALDQNECIKDKIVMLFLN